MSQRTAQANKAVEAAWKKEQKRVKEGKGTRDWSQQEQKDILEKGKAYDEDGKAYEGHHMKSVAEYPEYQGDDGNIQFLTREEHRAAHGWFGNPTNGYYNPKTGKTTDFGDGPYKPRRAFKLTEPILSREPVESEVKAANEVKQFEERNTQVSHEAFNVGRKSSHSHKGIGHIFEKVAENAVSFYTEHKETIKKGGKLAGALFLATVARGVEEKMSNRKNDYSSSDYGYDCNSRSYNNTSNDEADGKLARKSPKPHETSKYTRVRYGKVENVRGYKTGGNKENPNG